MEQQNGPWYKDHSFPSVFHLWDRGGIPTSTAVTQAMASGPRLRAPPSAEVLHSRAMDSTSDTTIKASKAGRPVLLSFADMPDWFQRDNNKWILHGYRPISGSVRISFRSWSYVHNESVNIYSHLIPAALFLFGEWGVQQYLTQRYPGVAAADRIAFSIFMVAAVTCLSLSATYHTLLNHSQHMEHVCLRLDMLGVVIFILGDLVLGIYVIFWCEPLPRIIYWSLVSPCLCIIRFSTLASESDFVFFWIRYRSLAP